MAAETQYTANTGLAQITTANTALDGSGTIDSTIWNVITGGSNGTLVRSITIKSIATTSEGMVRLFVYDGTNTRLLQEIHVPANTPSATNPAFEFTWNCDFKLEANFKIRATTQTNDDFNIIADGLDWAYFTSAVRPESTNYTANTSATLINSANTNLDGTGTLNTNIWTILTAGSSGSGWKGTRVESITIKATQTTTMGMVRLFVYNGSVTRLLTEIPVAAITQSGTEMTFERKINLGNFNLQAGWELRATTEKAEAFAISVEANDWKYPSATSSTNFTAASGTSTTSEEKLHTLQVPANILTTGDVLKVYANIEGTNSANIKTFRMYVNTSDSLSGATLLGTVQITTQTCASFMRMFPVISDTSLRCYSGTTTSALTQYNNTSGTSADTTVPSISAGFYILISGQKASAGETDTVRWSMFKKDN